MKSPKILAAVLAAGALVAATALPAAAVGTFNPQVPLASGGAFPQISVDPATGNALMVWQEQYEEGYGPIWGQIVNPELGVVLPPVLISTDESQVEWSQPFPAWNPDDNTWLVVWDNDTEIWGATFDTAGPSAPLLIADHVEADDTATFDDIEQVEAAWSTTTGVYLVGFKARSLPQNCQEIFGLLVDELGQGFTGNGASVLSSDEAGDPEGECDVIANNGLGLDWSSSTDEWLVTWYDEINSAEVARFIGVGLGVPVHASDVLDLGPNTASGAGSVIYDPANEQFLVAWHTDSDPETELRGAYVLADQTVGTSFAISDGSRDVRRPRLALDAAAGSILVVAHSDDDSDSVWLWELPAGSTTTVTTPVLLSDGVADNQRPVAAVANGCAIVVWQNLIEGDEVADVWTLLGRSTCAPAPVLPATGADSAPLMVFAAGFLAIGAAAIGIARARRSPAA